MKRLIRQNSTALNTSIHCSCQPRTKFSLYHTSRSRNWERGSSRIQKKKRHLFYQHQHLVLIFYYSKYRYFCDIILVAISCTHAIFNLIRLMDLHSDGEWWKRNRKQWHEATKSFFPISYFPTGAGQKIDILFKKSYFQILNFHKIHKLQTLIFTKFTI